MTSTIGPVEAAPRVWDVGASDEVAERGRLVVTLGGGAGGVTVGVFRFGGRLYAYENVCAHQGGPACQGRIVSRVRERLDAQQRSLGTVFDESTMHIVCPWHGFEYDVTTGRHPGRPDYALRPVGPPASAPWSTSSAARSTPVSATGRSPRWIPTSRAGCSPSRGGSTPSPPRRAPTRPPGRT
jgi:nitrite reductase/ring-hydroxylating ferredoxin subunit